MSKIGLVVTDHPVVISRKLRIFRKKDIIKELGVSCLGLEKEEAKEVVNNMFVEGLAVVSDNKEGINGLFKAYGWLLGTGVECKIIEEKKALKEAKKWLFEGVTGNNIDNHKISRRSLVHRIDLKKHAPKEFARLIKAVLNG